jgi:hypothetical protein
MSITVDATLFNGQFGLSLTASKADYNLDGAINMLNTYLPASAQIPSLTGAIGAHTGLYTSPQVGAIMAMAQKIYAKHFVNPSGKGSGGIGNLNLSYMVDPELLSFAEKLAERLKGSSIAFVVAEDTSGLT